MPIVNALLVLVLLPLDLAAPGRAAPLLILKAPKELHAGVQFSVDLFHTNMTGLPLRLRTTFHCQVGAEDALIVDGVEPPRPPPTGCVVWPVRSSVFGSPGAFVSRATLILPAGRHRLQFRYSAEPLTDGAWSGTRLSAETTVEVLP